MLKLIRTILFIILEIISAVVIGISFTSIFIVGINIPDLITMIFALAVGIFILIVSFICDCKISEDDDN